MFKSEARSVASFRSYIQIVLFLYNIQFFLKGFGKCLQLPKIQFENVNYLVHFANYVCLSLLKVHPLMKANTSIKLFFL